MQMINEREDYLSSSATANMAQWALNLHMQGYRSCHQMLTTFFATPTAPIKNCLKTVRQLTIVDLFLVSSMKITNEIAQHIFHQQLFSPEIVKTINQKNREEKLQQLKEKMGENSVYVHFSKETANYLNEFLPRKIGEKLTVIPEAVESRVLFKLGYIIRYCNYQLSKHYNYHEAFLSNKIGKRLQYKYNQWRVKFAHSLANKNNVHMVLDFEYVLLRLLENTQSSSKNSEQLPKLIIRSLAHSFSQQKKINSYLKNFNFSSEKEEIIAYLDWYKKEGLLPKSFPDLNAERLTPENLDEKLDQALNIYIEERMKIFLEKVYPERLKKGFLGLIYFLEGKDLFIYLLTLLVSEVGIKQLVDPHLFTIAVLNANGIEPMDYELDGFGRREGEKIFELGQQMLKESLSEKGFSSLAETFKTSGLKQQPLGLEGILQKQEAKNRLKNYIFSIVYEIIKSDCQQPDDFFKKFKEKTGQLPLVGTATASLHLLVNGTFLSLNYFFSEKNQKQMSYSKWMFKNLSGKKLANYVAERVVALIYHPAWRLTVMQLIESIFDFLENPAKRVNLLKNQNLKQDLQQITEFLYHHFVKSSSLPFQNQIGSLVDQLSQDEIYNRFLELLKPRDTSIINTGLNALIPNLKEFLLYTRLVEFFRKESVFFEGDSKFWEYFLRESLNELVEAEIQRTYQSQRPSLTEIFTIRERYVDCLLSLNFQELRIFLSKISRQTKMHADYAFLFNEIQEDDFYDINSSPNENFSDGEFCDINL